MKPARAEKWCWWPAQDRPERRCPASRTSRDGDWSRLRIPPEPAGRCASAAVALLPSSLCAPWSCPACRRSSTFASAAFFALHAVARAPSEGKILWASRKRGCCSIRVCRRSRRCECDGPHVYAGLRRPQDLASREQFRSPNLPPNRPRRRSRSSATEILGQPAAGERPRLPPVPVPSGGRSVFAQPECHIPAALLEAVFPVFGGS